MCETQDVDVLFKIDDDTYEQYKDNPAGLLQKIRHTLTALSFKIWSHSRKMCYFIAVAVWTQGCFNL